MSKIIALFNQAGGVGKSTTTQNLGYHLCLRSHRVLLVDIDPQASLTSFMGLEPAELKVTIYNSLVPEDEEYFILVDCPPSLGMLSHISLVAATHVLVPIQCQFKALMGTDALLKTVARIRKRLNPKLEFAGFLPTMYQVSNSLDNRTLKSIQEQLETIATIFPPMPRATAVAEAAEMGKPLALCPNKHKPTLELFNQIAIAMEKL